MISRVDLLLIQSERSIGRKKLFLLQIVLLHIKLFYLSNNPLNSGWNFTNQHSVCKYWKAISIWCGLCHRIKDLLLILDNKTILIFLLDDFGFIRFYPINFVDAKSIKGWVDVPIKKRINKLQIHKIYKNLQKIHRSGQKEKFQQTNYFSRFLCFLGKNRFNERFFLLQQKIQWKTWLNAKFQIKNIINNDNNCAKTDNDKDYIYCGGVVHLMRSLTFYCTIMLS